MTQAVAGFTLWLAIGCSGASGHARLVHVHPGVDATLAASPSSVQLRFDDPVDARLATIAVENSAGRRVDRGSPFNAHGRPGVVAVALASGVRGPVSVAWRIISDDGHAETGTSGFRVGAYTGARAARVNLRTTAPGVGTMSSIVRALHDLAVALALGLVLFGLFVRPRALDAIRRRADAGPAARDALGVFDGAALALMKRVARAGVLLALAGAWLEGATEAGTSPFDLMTANTAVSALSSRAACGWGIAVLAWMCVLLAVSEARQLRFGQPLLVVGVDALILAPVLCGHASGLLVLAAFAHVVAIAVWVGGLPALGLVAAAVGRSDLTPAAAGNLAGSVARAYSRLALPAALVVVGTGVLQAFARLIGPVDLLSTGYGRLLLLKVFGVCGLLMLGALNRRWLIPQMRGATAVSATRALQLTVAVEFSLAVGVFALTGVLTGSAPPQ